MNRRKPGKVSCIISRANREAGDSPGKKRSPLRWPKLPRLPGILSYIKISVKPLVTSVRKDADETFDLPAVAAHHFHDERALVRISRGRDRIDSLDDSVERRVRTDRHISAAKVVINRSHHSNDIQVAKFDALFVGYFP